MESTPLQFQHITSINALATPDVTLYAIDMEETALVPVTPKPVNLRRKDKYGLRLNQKRALIALCQGGSWEQAAKEACVEVQTLKDWAILDPAFKTEYDNLLAGLLTDVKHRMSTMLPKVGDVMAEALDAGQALKVGVVCPDCGAHYDAIIDSPNWAVRLRVAENLLKQHGQLASKIEVEGDIKHTHVIELSTDDRIALQLIRRGKRESVPPDVYESLLSRGVIDAEYRELDNTEATQD